MGTRNQVGGGSAAPFFVLNEPKKTARTAKPTSKIE
jgi:hypothetical protein